MSDAGRKAPAALRTIGEVSADLSIPQHILRFWESKFTQLRPVKRSGNRRYYRPEDIVLIQRIDLLLKQDGYTIAGVQRLLRQSRKSVDTDPHVSLETEHLEQEINLADSGRRDSAIEHIGATSTINNASEQQSSMVEAYVRQPQPSAKYDVPGNSSDLLVDDEFNDLKAHQLNAGLSPAVYVAGLKEIKALLEGALRQSEAERVISAD